MPCSRKGCKHSGVAPSILVVLLKKGDVGWIGGEHVGVIELKLARRLAGTTSKSPRSVRTHKRRLSKGRRWRNNYTRWQHMWVTISVVLFCKHDPLYTSVAWRTCLYQKLKMEAFTTPRNSLILERQRIHQSLYPRIRCMPSTTPPPTTSSLLDTNANHLLTVLLTQTTTPGHQNPPPQPNLGRLLNLSFLTSRLTMHFNWPKLTTNKKTHPTHSRDRICFGKNTM